MILYLWGSSDDLVEFSGDHCEEYYAPDDSFKVLFSDGTIINGRYDEDWNYHVDKKGTLECTRYRAGTPEAMAHCDRDYSDVIKIEGDFDWFTVTSNITEVKR